MPRFGSRNWKEIVLCFTASRPALGPPSLLFSEYQPIQYELGALSFGIKWLGHEDDHSPPSSAEVNNDGAISLAPHMYLYIFTFSACITHSLTHSLTHSWS
jgi:hypothetical protein